MSTLGKSLRTSLGTSLLTTLRDDLPWESGFGGGAAAAPPVAGALAYWPMDASLTSIRDYTGRGNDLTKNMLPAGSSLDFCFGANQANAQFVTGRQAKWGAWHRKLTAAEVLALEGAEGWPFAVTTSLRDATAYFLCDEPDNTLTFADATGRGNDLSWAGVVLTTRVAGPLGTDFAARFGVGGSSLFRRVNPGVDLKGGNFDMTVAGWVYFDSLGASQQLFWGQIDLSASPVPTGSISPYYHAPNGTWQVDVGNGVDLYRNAVVVAATAGTPSTAGWYFIRSEYDAASNVATQYVTPLGGARTADTLGPIQQPAPVQAGSHIAAQFRVNPQYLGNTSGWDNTGKYNSASHASNSNLSIGNNAKAVWGWVKFTDTATTQVAMGIFDSATNAMDWCIQQTGGNLYFLLGDAVGGFDFTSVALASTGWHMFFAWYDKLGDGKIHLSLDNGAATSSASLTHTPATSSLPFVMGSATHGATQDLQLLANVCLAGMSNGAPTAADMAKLFALGAGLT